MINGRMVLVGCLLVASLNISAAGGPVVAQQAEDVPSPVELARFVQPRVVKIQGVGGLQRLESYQSGIRISADGLVLTSWSYVLDVDELTVVLGRVVEVRRQRAEHRRDSIGPHLFLFAGPDRHRYCSDEGLLGKCFVPIEISAQGAGAHRHDHVSFIL